jgi:hypothetical protein
MDVSGHGKFYICQGRLLVEVEVGVRKGILGVSWPALR